MAAFFDGGEVAQMRAEVAQWNDHTLLFWNKHLRGELMTLAIRYEFPSEKVMLMHKQMQSPEWHAMMEGQGPSMQTQPPPRRALMPASMQTQTPQPEQTMMPASMQTQTPQPMQTMMQNTTAVPEPGDDGSDPLNQAVDKYLQTKRERKLMETKMQTAWQTTVKTRLQTLKPANMQTMVPGRMQIQNNANMQTMVQSQGADPIVQRLLRELKKDMAVDYAREVNKHKEQERQAKEDEMRKLNNDWCELYRLAEVAETQSKAELEDLEKEEAERKKAEMVEAKTAEWAWYAEWDDGHEEADGYDGFPILPLIVSEKNWEKTCLNLGIHTLFEGRFPTEIRTFSLNRSG